MRLSFAQVRVLPLMAAVALAACSSDADEELTDETLSAEDLLGDTIADNGALPQPGEYRTGFELLSVDVPGATSVDMDALNAAFMEGAGEQPSFCVTEAMDRASWISAMTDNSCTLSRVVADGDQIDMAMTCDAEDGPQGRITLVGTQGETGSNMEMRFTQPIDGHGDANITARLTSERTGDCG